MGAEHTDIRKFILEAFAPQMRDTDLADDLQLFKARIIDSISIVRLICFLEDHYQIRVRPHEIIEENLGTIEASGASSTGRGSPPLT